jgi:hypothetical protein
MQLVSSEAPQPSSEFGQDECEAGEQPVPTTLFLMACLPAEWERDDSGADWALYAGTGDRVLVVGKAVSSSDMAHAIDRIYADVVSVSLEEDTTELVGTTDWTVWNMLVVNGEARIRWRVYHLDWNGERANFAFPETLATGLTPTRRRILGSLFVG